jgi:hypothetical protein
VNLPLACLPASLPPLPGFRRGGMVLVDSGVVFS